MLYLIHFRLKATTNAETAAKGAVLATVKPPKVLTTDSVWPDRQHYIKEVDKPTIDYSGPDRVLQTVE